MLLALFLACGGAPTSPIVGCWKSPTSKSIECFEPDGKYAIGGGRLGALEGTWALSGSTLTLTVAQFPPEDYEMKRDGEKLVLTRKGGKAREYERVQK